MRARYADNWMRRTSRTPYPVATPAGKALAGDIGTGALCYVWVRADGRG